MRCACVYTCVRSVCPCVLCVCLHLCLHVRACLLCVRVLCVRCVLCVPLCVCCTCVCDSQVHVVLRVRVHHAVHAWTNASCVFCSCVYVSISVMCGVCVRVLCVGMRLYTHTVCIVCVHACVSTRSHSRRPGTKESVGRISSETNVALGDPAAAWARRLWRKRSSPGRLLEQTESPHLGVLGGQEPGRTELEPAGPREGKREGLGTLPAFSRVRWVVLLSPGLAPTLLR